MYDEVCEEPHFEFEAGCVGLEPKARMVSELVNRGDYRRWWLAGRLAEDLGSLLDFSLLASL